MTAGLVWETSPAAGAACAAVAVAGTVAAWHYARSGPFGVAGALRATAVVLLALTTLRPGLRYESPTNVTRPLRVVVDDSLSMAVADARPSADWLRVAAALGQFMPPARPAGPAGTNAKATADTAADSGRDTLDDDEDATAAVDRLDGTSRYALALDAVARLRAGGVVRAVTLDGAPLDASRATPLSPSTPLSAALRDACARATATREEAVVLLSDGRSTEARSLLPQAAAAGVAVYAVAVAPEDRSPDVRVTRIDTPPVVRAGQDVPVRVRLTQRNLDNRPVHVTLADDRGRTITRDAPAGGDVTVSMLWPDASGPLKLTASAGPVAGERWTANNAKSTVVDVTDRRLRVRLMSGSPSSRDTEELAAAASATKWIDLSRGAADGGGGGGADFDADVIVLADLAPDALNDVAWDGLRRAVRERGASLLALAGRGDWLRDASTASRLAPLLPTTPGPQPAWVSPPQPVWPVPTREGLDAAYLRTDESIEASRRTWLGRPRLSRVLSLGPPAVRARTLLFDRVTGLPVLVEAAVGGGRCAAVLVDEAWRWSAADSPDASRQFWVGLLQSMADLPYDKTGDGLAASVDRVSPTAGRTLFARVRVADPSAGAVSVSLTKDGSLLPAPPLRELLAGGGRFVVPINGAAGRYELTVRQGGRSLAIALTIAEESSAESLDPSPDLGQLQRIADATGGAMLPLEDLGRLPDLLAARRNRMPRIETYALWCSPWWFVTIVACLCLEWAVRPRAGLA